MYNSQMEMFQDGGLKDQGNTTDPVSGNDVPSGSLKEEVRDDIDAKLSPGEFVFPADVVRFIGLEKLMMIRDKAKKGLSRMEEMGQMGNSEEATIDDDVPFGMEDLIIVSGGPENEMSKGGVPTYANGGVGRGEKLVSGGDGYQPPTRYHNPATGQEMMVTKIAGKFFPPLPEGFVPKPTIAQANPTSGTKVGTTSVMADDKTDESVAGFDVNNAGFNADGTGTRTPQESAGGEQRGNAGTEKSVDEMTPNERADFGDWALANPTIANAVFGFANLGTSVMKGQFGSPISMLSNITQRALGIADIEIGIGTMNRANVEKLSKLRKTNPLAFAEVITASKTNAMRSANKSLANMSVPTTKAALSTSYGASPGQIAHHADEVSRGNRPQGSSPNAVGGYTTVSNDRAQYEYSTNQYGEIDANQTQKDKDERDLNNFERKGVTSHPGTRSKSDRDEAKTMRSAYDITREVDPGDEEGNTEPGPSAIGGTAGSQSDDTGPDEGNTEAGPDQRGGVSEPGVDQFGGPDTRGGFSGAGGSGPAEAPGADTSETADDDSGAGVEGSKGGFIPKRKKQKKMKRGGLASRK